MTSSINGEKLPIQLKQEITNEEDRVPVTSKPVVISNIIGVLNKITPEDMITVQQVGVKIGKVIRYVKLNKKLSPA